MSRAAESCPSNAVPLGFQALYNAARVAIWLMFAALALGCAAAHASNPRWVTGPPYFNAQQPGVPVIWYTRTPMYFTDPGDLSPFVDHATADALVAAAASVWNVPTADFTIAQGGTLAEHVSGANAYAGSDGVVFPADVDSSNYSAVQIAVVYDTDGSVTDMLLGSGASSPIDCLQYAVTESVDSISTSGFIQHAVIVLNGRCTGPAPEQQLQMRYQLERAFGRVFGVGWSQNNDNVFTRSPAPSLIQAQHWPIMHPIDIVCGLYTYQCLPNPFTLRDDDIASITALYRLGYNPQLGWIGYNQWLPGKVQSYSGAARAFGTMSFPNGQGMQGVNVVVQRIQMFSTNMEPWQEVSGVSGFAYRQSSGNPVTGSSADIASSMGTTDPGYEGHFDFPWLPLMNPQDPWVNIQLTWEPINSLYTGAHSVGPYVSTGVSPSGSPSPIIILGLWPSPGSGYAYDLSFTPSGATDTCAASNVGVESAPAPVVSTGWWTDRLCGYNHAAWTSFTPASGHTATVEITALDESGLPTVSKAQPVIGAWTASDATGTSPSVDYTAGAFNTFALGTTGLRLTGDGTALRLGFADSRGDGRPDYNYRARILYVDSVQPTTASQGGSLITIRGMGFRPGLRVLINGVPAAVANATANTLTAVAPPVSTFGAAPVGPVEVQVQDVQTGGSSILAGALSYGAIAGDVITLVAAPSGTVQAGVTAGQFSARLLLNDGVTPVAGMPMIFSASGAAVSFAGCSGSPCVALTDATGVASVTVTPTAYGAVTLTAAAGGATQSASFTAVSRAIVAPQETLYVATGSTFTWNAQADLFENNVPAPGIPVSWTGTSGFAVASSAIQTSADGVAQSAVTVGPLASGAQRGGQVCAWTGPVSTTLCAVFTAVAVDPSAFKLLLFSGGGQAIPLTGSFNPVVVQVVDAAGHPVAGAAVTVHQSVDQIQMQCPDHGACPIPQGLGSSSTTLLSDASGLIKAVPLQLPGQAEVTHLALSAGAAGFLSLSVTQGQ